MAINFPTSLDALTNPTPTDYLNSPSHSGQHANANDILEALEAKVGINSSAVTSSFDYRINAIETWLSEVTGADKAVGKTATQTLTNKTLTSPKINENVAVTATATEINKLAGLSTTAEELGLLSGILSIGKSKVGTISRNLATTTDLAITGVGFKPNKIIMIGVGGVDSDNASVGFADSARSAGCIRRQTGANWSSANRLCSLRPSSGIRSIGVKSYDSDGFTLEFFTDYGSPTGTATLYYIAMS